MINAPLPTTDELRKELEMFVIRELVKDLPIKVVIASLVKIYIEQGHGNAPPLP